MNPPSTPNSKTVNPHQEELDIPSSPPKDVLEQMLQRQQTRATNRLRPLSSSSPSKEESDSLSPSAIKRGRNYHHSVESPRSQNLNQRNKHNKIRQIRNQHRHEKLMSQREDIYEHQFRGDVINQYEAEYESITKKWDIDKLIEDEHDLEYEQRMLEKYIEEEVEDREWEEDEELIDLISSLEIQDTR
ncbi:hypothetical protein SBY92_003163 [Candida maltosa Xu316]